VGGYAVSLHGAIRGTMDIDIVINWTLPNLKKTGNALERLGLVSRLPVSAEEIFHFRDEYMVNRKLIAWNFYDPANLANQVDVIVSYDLKGKKRKRLESSAGDIHVLHIDDLIRMKKQSGRPQDLEDVAALERLR
jgi:hypothetical protein